MKKALKWLGIAVLTPILLIVILAALIYLPPVQNWAVKKVTAIASEKTGMQISIEHVNLEFPLDLGIEGFRALHPSDSISGLTDTIADVRKLVCDVRLLPLLQKRVVIDELSLTQAKLNTNGFIGDLRVKGSLQELWLSSRGIDLDKETVEVNGARLTEAHLDIALSDTAAVDTTESTAKWIVNADSVSILKSELAVHLPGDTLHAKAYMGRAVARQVLADLGRKIYKVGSLEWRQGRLNYDNRYEPEAPGLDYNHLALTDFDLRVDSIEYIEPNTSLIIKYMRAKEKSGLELKDLYARVTMDDKRLVIPQLRLRTTDTEIDTELAMDLNTFDTHQPGDMRLRLNAQIGKQDVMRFVGDLPQQFVRSYPNHPISIKGSVNGNMQNLSFTGLDIHLPTAFRMTASGTAENLTDITQMKADVSLNARTDNMNFMLALADPALMRDYRIPAGMLINGTLKADGTRYAANLTAREGAGLVRLKAIASIPTNARGELMSQLMSYDADLSVTRLNLHHFMPRDSIYTFTADVKAKGFGTDFLSNKSRLTADAKIHQLQYGSWDLRDINAEATLYNGHALASVIGHNQLLDGKVGIDALLNTKRLVATISADLRHADLYKMRLVSDTMSIGLCGSIDVVSDMKLTHRVTGLVDEVYIRDEKTTYRPDFVGIHINTSVDTVIARIQSGDFIVKLDASGNYERLLKRLSMVADSTMAQLEKRVIDQPAIKRLLPDMKLHIESKRDNPLASLMEALDIKFKEMMIDVNTSPETGINGQSYLYSLVYDSTRLDTIRLNLTQKGDRLTYQGQIRNNRRNPQFVFNALIDGTIHRHGALVGLRYYDQRDRMGVRLGVTAEMEDKGIRFRLLPERPTIGYKVFNLNKDNYLFLGRNKRLQAKVDLIADDKTGIKLYTESQDSTMLQDITLSINQLDLGELTSVIPYLPRITGKLNGDFHILQDRNENISVASDMGVRQMAYEGSPIGNISTELVYLMKEDDTHAVEARLMLDEEEFGMLSGIYKSDGFIDAKFDMNRLPLSLVNGFVPDQMVGLEGYGEGSVTIRGTTDHPEVNGEMLVDSAYLVSIPYGIRMRFDNDPVRIIGSKVLLENFGLYSSHNDLLNLMGSIDFSNTDRIMMDMRMRARDFLLIDSKQQAKSVAWGKAFVNFFARMQGPLEELNMRGRLDVLGSTDITYMLLDSPLSTDNRLEELVKFTDFSDSTTTVVTRPAPSGVNIDLNVSVSQGAHVLCNLNTDETNYVDLMGGGDLRMKYTSEGINLTGRYTLSSGQMKYSLPVIPLKTFTVKEGSYVEFTGDPMNPKLNITATERTKSTVTNEAGGNRTVIFDCGVIITKTLSDMGLEFTIDAPEDQTISGELATMSKEERGKMAVGMLTTGMYLADGNTGAFSMNSALSSFLQSEINNIAGSALKTLDLSVGIDNSTDASGAIHTDYSFKFAKRFFNNRLKIELGGKVSSGTNDAMAGGQDQSFFDNVTMEYRLNQDATKNLKLFYNQNVYDWLEGYSGEYGVGFVWRRKLNSLLDVLTFWKSEPQPQYAPRDTTRTVIPVVTNEK